MKEKLMKVVNITKEFALKVLGHGVTGALTGVVFELERMLALGTPLSQDAIIVGVMIGSAIGFCKAVLEAVDTVKPKTDAVAMAVNKKTLRSYFGF